MNTVVNWIDYWDRKVKNFSIWDLKLAQLWTAIWVLIFIKLFPVIAEISYSWLITILILCLPRLVYVVFMKK